jgi:predicted metal-dependent HD superfamily phosphohydrolase
MEPIDKLNHLWQKLWRFRTSIDLNQQEIDRVFQLLVAAYTQSDRYYHNLAHIYHVLTILNRYENLPIERISQRIQEPISVLLAAWFHDFIYDPQASDNESQSAKFAGELLKNIGESTELIDRVQQLIMATQGHQLVGVASPLENPLDRDLGIFLDADLAILGTDSARYQTYARSIRLEYDWVSDELYCAGRTSILKTFLQRDRIYHTELLFDELEPAARLNIQQELLFLKTMEPTVGAIHELPLLSIPIPPSLAEVSESNALICQEIARTP